MCVLQWLQSVGTEGMTLRELSAALGIPIGHVYQTLRNLKREGLIGIVRPRKVSYRNRPVSVYVLAELMPATTTQQSDTQRLASAMQVWGRVGAHG